MLNGKNIITSTEDFSEGSEVTYVLNHEASLAGKQFRFTCDLTIQGRPVTLTLTNTFPATFEGSDGWDCFVSTLPYTVGAFAWEEEAEEGEAYLTFRTMPEFQATNFVLELAPFGNIISRVQTLEETLAELIETLTQN